MAATTSNSKAEADRLLVSYVLDYLIKRGMHETAESFRKESRGVLIPNWANKPNGFLYEWWSDFQGCSDFNNTTMGPPAACSLPSEMNDIENLPNQLAKVMLAEANEGLVASNYPLPGLRNKQVLPTSVLQAPNYQQLCPETKTQDQEAHVLQLRGDEFQRNSSFNNAMGRPGCSDFNNTMGPPAACSLPSEMNGVENLTNQLAKVIFTEANNEGIDLAPLSEGPPNASGVPVTTSLLQAPNYQQLCPKMKTQDQEAHVPQLLGHKFQGNSSFNNAMGPPEANNEGDNLVPLHGCPPNVPPSLLQAPKDQQRCLEMKTQAIEARYQQLCLEMEAQLLGDNNSLETKTQAQEARYQQLYLEMEAQLLGDNKSLEMKTQAREARYQQLYLEMEAHLLGAQCFSSNNEVLSCHFSSDGKILASAGLERKVFIYNMETSNLVTTSEQHLNLITDVRFKPDSTIFATSSFDRALKIWDAAKPSKSLFKLTGHTGLVMSLDFHPTEADILCSSDSNETIAVWNVNKRVMLKNFKGGKTQVRFQPRFGRYLATATRSYINIIETHTWSVVGRLDKGHISSVNSICWDTNGNFLASVSFEGACVWSGASGGFSCIHELHSNGERFQSCVFHPRYPSVLVIGSDKRLVLWIPESGQTRRIPAHNGSITGLAASTQNGKFASASRDHHVKLWK